LAREVLLSDKLRRVIFFSRKICKFSPNFCQNAILQLLLQGRDRQKENLIFILATGGHFGNDFGEPKYFRGKFYDYD
jgi:hypothetical protein